MKKSRLLGAVCVCIINIGMIAISEAALVEVDWQNTGDKLLTQDTEAGLEWMDINPTYYITANQMLSLFAPGELYEGFRFATTNELITILSHAGVTAGTGNVSVDIGEASEVSAFINMVGGGTTHNVSQSLTQTTANARTVETIGFNTTLYFSALNYLSDGRTLFSPRFGTEDPNRPDADGGNWIVRNATITAVPIPSALWLLGSGLIGLLGLVKQRNPS